MKSMKTIYMTSLLLTALAVSGCASLETNIPSMTQAYENAVAYLKERWAQTDAAVESWSQTIQRIQDSPLFYSAAAPSNVNRLLNQLRQNTNAELKQEDRQRAARQNNQLREQVSPGNPQNAVEKQKEELNNRIANLEDKQKAQADHQKS